MLLLVGDKVRDDACALDDKSVSVVKGGYGCGGGGGGKEDEEEEEVVFTVSLSLSSKLRFIPSSIVLAFLLLTELSPLVESILLLSVANLLLRTFQYELNAPVRRTEE